MIVGERQQAIDKQLKIVSNKQSTSRTAVEHPCDLSPYFMSFRKLANGTTRENAPVVSLQLKAKKKFAELKAAVTIDFIEKKASALIDFLGAYPLIVSQACPTESVARGFLLNIMVDKPSLSFPDITQIFQTCKNKKRMADHHNLIKDKFEKCYIKFAEQGIISNGFQEQIGIPADVNYAGDNTPPFSLYE